MASTTSGDPHRQRAENALDALLDELQTFARPPSEAGSRKGSLDGSGSPVTTVGSLRRLHSYPSSDSMGSPVRAGPPIVSRLQVSDGSGKHSVSLSSTPTSSPIPPSLGDGKVSPTPTPPPALPPKPAIPERRVPPPPPPRTSSRSPLVSPTSPMSPQTGASTSMRIGPATLPRRPGPSMLVHSSSEPRDTGTLRRGIPGRSSLREPLRGPERLEPERLGSEENLRKDQLSSNSSSSESVNSQEGMHVMRSKHGQSEDKSGQIQSRTRQEVLEQRHQELLRKQKQLQEQYARLQQLQRGTMRLAPINDLKKTGSESNILAKMGVMNLSAAPTSGSLTHLAPLSAVNITFTTCEPTHSRPGPPVTATTAQSTETTITSASSTTPTASKIYETDIL